jgi:hypothetical protein
MKNLLIIAALMLSALTMLAQAPQGVNYQAVVRNNAGDVIKNQSVRFRLSITEGAAGSTTYSETQQVTTNSLGLVNLTIGNGTVVSGTFASVNWASGQKFLKIEVDATGGTNYVLMGSQQFVSVPYALHANTATSVSNQWQLNANGLHYNSGKIGIGINLPEAKLSLVGDESGVYPDGTPDTRRFLQLKNTSTSQYSVVYSQYQAGASNTNTTVSHASSSYFLSDYADFGQIWSTGKGIILRASPPSATDPNIGVIKFQTGYKPDGQSFERMRINTDGKIGIGTASPTSWLTVQADADGSGSLDSRHFLTLRNTSTSNSSATSMFLNAGNSGTFTLLNHHSSTYNVVNNAADYGQLWNNGKGLIIRASPSSATTNLNGNIRFFTGYNATDILDNYNSYERMRLTHEGNLGIGTITPTAQFHTTGTVRFQGIPQNNSLTRILASDNNGVLSWRDVSTFTGTSQWVTNTNGINFNSGRVGIGTSTPLTKLHLEGDESGFGTVDGRMFLRLNNTSNSSASNVSQMFQAGTSGSFTIINHHSSTYTTVPNADDMGQMWSSGKGLIIRASPVSATQDLQGSIRFYTGWNANSTFSSNERLRIDFNGNIGIGTEQPKAKLEVKNGDVYVNDATKGIILKSPNGNCWRVTIDDTGNFVRTQITCPQ